MSHKSYSFSWSASLIDCVNWCLNTNWMHLVYSLLKWGNTNYERPGSYGALSFLQVASQSRSNSSWTQTLHLCMCFLPTKQYLLSCFNFPKNFSFTLGEISLFSFSVRICHYCLHAVSSQFSKRSLHVARTACDDKTALCWKAIPFQVYPSDTTSS